MPYLNAFEPVVAGNSATTVAQFTLPVGTDASSGTITYELLDAVGQVYASGGSTGYSFANTVNGVSAQATVIVAVPSNIPTNIIGESYQVRFTLTTADTTFQAYSNIVVQPLGLTYQGAEDVIELSGNTVQMNLVLPAIFSNVTADFYFQNTKINPLPPTISGPTATADGYLYTLQLTLDPTIVPATLAPYHLLWSYNNGPGTSTGVENAAVYCVTPSMMQAMKDLLAEINKARSSLGDRPTFSVLDAFTHLRLGGDLWNAFAQPTTFTFTNATGGVRAYWLGWSKVSALRSQYLFEGESAFDFGGQAISLNIDRTQYYEGMASALESSLNDPGRQFKGLLAKRGNTGGDGNVNPNKLQYGAIGTVGVTLSPVANIRPWNQNTWLGGQRNIF